MKSAASQIFDARRKSLPSSATTIADFLDDMMASISSKIFTVAEHTPEDGEHRATRRFLMNPDCLKPFKLSAGEVVAVASAEYPDTAVGIQCSIYFCCSDVSLTRFLQSFSVGVLWPDSGLEKDGHPLHQIIRHYLIAHFQ